MDYNSLIEIGSKANVILRFKTPIEVNGVRYEANEPYLFLKDVNVVVDYRKQDAVAATNKNVMAYSNIKPRSVAIGGMSFSRKLAALLASFSGTNETYNPTIFRTLAAEKVSTDSEGIIFLTDEFDAAKSFFVMDDKMDKIDATKVTYDAAMNALISSEFEDNKRYLISFSSVKIGTKFNLNKDHVPYMSLEIQGTGNIDKITKEVVMYFDKVSLNSEIQFTFIQGDLINVPLEFYIIDDKNNYIVFED